MTKNSEQCRISFLEALGRPYLGEELFDAVADTVFFLKDGVGRYVAVNQTLVSRVGLKKKSDLIGRTAHEVFPGLLGQRFFAQDKAIVEGGRSLHGELELHLYPDGEEGWCLTWKEPVLGADGTVIGLSGISRDLQSMSVLPNEMHGVSRALDHIRKHLDKALRLSDLAALSSLSVFQFDSRIRTLYGISAGQYITRARIDLACKLLRQTDVPISSVALDCGYGDQAAFTRQFRRSVGLTPGAYREQQVRSSRP